MTEHSKHTPGPWKVHPYRNVSVGPYNKGIDVGPYGRAVARVIGAFEEQHAGPEAEANARLIAAAPEMLRVLKVVESFMDAVGPAYRDDLQQVRDVIAKAEGR